VAAGFFILALALASAGISLWINFQAGMIVGLSIACMLAISDLGKVIIPVVCKGIGWNLQTRLTYAAVSVASVVCAFIFVTAQFEAKQAAVSNTAVNTGLADQRIADLRSSLKTTRDMASTEAKDGGCGPKCQSLNDQAGNLETAITEALAARKAMPTKSAVPDQASSLLLTILGFTAMELISHLAAAGAALIGLAMQKQSKPVKAKAKAKPATRKKAATKPKAPSKRWSQKQTVAYLDRVLNDKKVNA
jgi:hypothetical protein